MRSDTQENLAARGIAIVARVQDLRHRQLEDDCDRVLRHDRLLEEIDRLLRRRIEGAGCRLQ